MEKLSFRMDELYLKMFINRRSFKYKLNWNLSLGYTSFNVKVQVIIIENAAVNILESYGEK